MNPQNFHWLEKVQAQLVSIAGIALMYFLLWPVLRNPMPTFPTAFVAGGGLSRLAILAAILWGVSAVAALLTVRSRPETALLVTAFSVGGLSLRSPRIEPLLWPGAAAESVGALFWLLATEVVLLAVVLAGAAAIVYLIRRGVRAIKPGWLWRSPLAEPIEQLHVPAGMEAVPATWGTRLVQEILPAGKDTAGEGASRKGRKSKRAKADNDTPVEWALLDRRKRVVLGSLCLVTTLLVSVPLMMMFLQSPLRGQVLFALLMAFFLGTLVAHQVFPTSCSFTVWPAAVVAAVVCYALGSFMAISDVPDAWLRVQNYARPLPIDWLSAGIGGSLLGFWVSERLHEIRHVSRPEND